MLQKPKKRPKRTAHVPKMGMFLFPFSLFNIRTSRRPLLHTSPITGRRIDRDEYYKRITRHSKIRGRNF